MRTCEDARTTVTEDAMAPSRPTYYQRWSEAEAERVRRSAQRHVDEVRL
jgi:hypothetical protein